MSHKRVSKQIRRVRSGGGNDEVPRQLLTVTCDALLGDGQTQTYRQTGVCFRTPPPPVHHSARPAPRTSARH